jgi:hypothetical protein
MQSTEAFKTGKWQREKREENMFSARRPAVCSNVRVEQWLVASLSQ